MDLEGKIANFLLEIINDQFKLLRKFVQYFKIADLKVV